MLFKAIGILPFFITLGRNSRIKVSLVERTLTNLPSYLRLVRAKANTFINNIKELY